MNATATMRSTPARRQRRSLIWGGGGRGTPDATARRPSPAAAPARAVQTGSSAAPVGRLTGRHPLTQAEANARLYDYEQAVKGAFARIVPTLKAISARQHDADFEARAQAIARQELGFELPPQVLADAWVNDLDLRVLFAHCMFETFQRMSAEFFGEDPLQCRARAETVKAQLREWGFHRISVTPCSDGRLAHTLSYVLRLPVEAVRRRSYAGAMFDVEEAVNHWVGTEMRRYREADPNPADEPTRFLKIVAYHFSSVDPAHQGCAAHGSDTEQAAAGGLGQLTAFREAIENSFCCGASVDMLLVGIDTDTDQVRIHVPDGEGNVALTRYLDSARVYVDTQSLSPYAAREAIAEQVDALNRRHEASPAQPGMARLIAWLLENNMSQIDYVLSTVGEHYPDIGHQERFMGIGVDFAEVQLRNLTYFAYMDTVEEGAPNLDVGIKIFRKLNVAHGLPIPIVVRFEYPGHVPGARERAIARCARVAEAIARRYPDLSENGLLYTYWTVRDSCGDAPVECVGSSLPSVAVVS